VTQPPRWTSVAHDRDYFDQSHFIHDFERYAGLSPTDYLAQRSAVYAQQPDHASVPWVLPAG
jgi:AraC-like DNA-binding protein